MLALYVICNFWYDMNLNEGSQSANPTVDYQSPIVPHTLYCGKIQVMNLITPIITRTLCFCQAEFFLRLINVFGGLTPQNRLSNDWPPHIIS